MRDGAAPQAGDLTLQPYIVKTDLFGPDTDRYRFAAQLGQLLVPENRQNPAGRLIELAFIHIKSRAPQPGPPLMILPGGPGVAGSEWARLGAFAPWFEELLNIGDVILLDQRGTGLSNPRLDCLQRWNLPLDQPGDRDTFLRVARERGSAAAAFWRDYGVDLAGYTTEESADDIESLRVALGLSEISLYGASYGSHLALAALRRHGPHIARAIVALVEGPDHTIKLPSNIQRHLLTLARLLQADDRLSRDVPDLLALMQRTLDQLEARPEKVEVVDKDTGEQVSVVVGKFDLQRVTAGGLGDRRFLQQLPRRYQEMSRGDYSWLGQEVLQARRAWIGNAMSYCMDSASGASPERMARVASEAGEALLADVMDLPFPYVSAAWGVPALGAQFRSPITTDVPVLFISGTLDGRTPPSNVEEIRPGFSTSGHMVIQGGTHSSSKLVAVPAVRAVMASFLRGETAPDQEISVPFSFAPLED